jgi:hypothetical protein
MDPHVLEITVWHRSGETWPVVADYTEPNELPRRYKDELRLQGKWEQDLLKLSVDTQKYGTMLGKSLLSGKIAKAFTTACAESSGKLRVLLNVEAPDLRHLHWERLCAPILIGDRWGFLALDQRFPYSIYLPSPTDRRFPAFGSSDLRALVLVANPPADNDYNIDRFEAKATVASIQTALEGIRYHILANVPDADGPPTLNTLLARLTDQHFTLLHIVAHGRYDTQDGETIVYLLDEEEQIAPVAATDLLNRLYQIEGPRGLPHLAFLSTCESARPEAESSGALGGLAQRLVRELGMPAVLAMTEKVSIATAETLSKSFYVFLREHGWPDRALVEATTDLVQSGDKTVPALYSRLGGRPLFSDAEERDLTRTEIEDGLAQIEGLLKRRAPVLQKDFLELASTLQGMLDARNNLSETAKAEWDQAETRIYALCKEVLDLNFRGLALGQQPPPYDSRCPFPGLFAFQAEKREFFKGREELVEKLVTRLAGHSFLAVLGPSGCGKSSLVLAGLVPTLRDTEPDLQMAYMTPGNDPCAQLAASLDATGAGSGDQSVILVVDQFEELFTLTAEEDRQDFIDQLLALAGEHRVVLTMRADFWGDCAPYENLPLEMQAHQELIRPMTTAELRSAMEEQAAAVRLRFEADLANTILDAVKDEPGAMPLLQHLLWQLWRRRHGRWLLSQEYRKLGGVERAISETAEKVYSGLAPAEQEHVRYVFLRLTRLDERASIDEDLRDTRQRVALAELTPVRSDPDVTKRLVKSLADARLVVTRDSQVEVAHEALIQYWPRLREWLDAGRENLLLRQRIHQVAEEWQDSHRDESYLLHQGRRLESAVDLASHRMFDLSPTAQDYIDACIALQERSSLVEARIRIFDRFESGGFGYPVELSVPGWGESRRGQIFAGWELGRSGDLFHEGTGYLVGFEEYGRALGEQLFADEAVGRDYRNVLTSVRRQGGKLQVRLRLDPPELQTIAWESMHHPVGDDWHQLAVGADTSFSRQVPAQDWEPAQPLAVRPLRVLAIIASPSGLERYGLADLSSQSLRDALDRIPDLAVTYLETGTPSPPTLAGVCQALAEGHHLVHFLCHSKEVDQSAWLFLEGEDGRVQRVGEAKLIPAFSTLRQPPLLCFLADDQTSSLALGLLGQTSIQAVVAATARWTLRTHDRFTEQFYTRLLAHGMVDLAMNEARAMVLDRDDWFAPALLCKLPRNRLITVSRASSLTTSETHQEHEAHIRVYSTLGEKGGYPVELSIPDRREFPRGTMHLNIEQLAEEVDPRVYGQTLGEALFDPRAIGDAFRETVTRLLPDGGRLRLRLRLDPPNLHHLYWERLHHPQEGQWYPSSATPDTPFSRYIPVQRWESPSPLVERPLRLLAVIAWPLDLERFGMSAIAEEELNALHAILDDLPDSDVETTYLQTGKDQPTLNRMLQEMLTGKYHLLHCFCHNVWSAERREGVLFLEDNEGKVDMVDAHKLTRVFRMTAAAPSLCFFSSAQSVTSPFENSLGPIAMELVERTRVQAAVAMTGQVGLAAAGNLVERFYHRLLDHGQVDLALNEARASVRGETDWDPGVPILFSRLPGNQLLGF